MSGPASNTPGSSGDEPQEVTMMIKALSLKTTAEGDDQEKREGKALLLTRDNDSRKWGARWLQQSGLQATVPTDIGDAAAKVAAAEPDILVIEAALPGVDGQPLYAELQNDPEFDAQIIVLCSNAKEISAAYDVGVLDIARKPFVWQFIAKRAETAWDLELNRRLLCDRNKSLQEALDLADSTRRQLRSQQKFEPVTGLPNKSKFMDLLRRGMRAIDRDENALAVFVIGFTRFRLVIEAMGQQHADRVLSEIGQILAECLQKHGTSETLHGGLRTAAVASLDQFRFGLMMTCSGRDDELVAFQQRLLETLSQPVQVSGQIVQLSACLGVALYPQDADDVDSLLQRADNAMRDAQSSGGGYRFYSSETDAAAARKLKVEHLLHEALDREELSVAYQPIVDVASGAVIAAEALLRWRQSDGSYISPNEFVPIAEESGLLVRAGAFILDEACRQLAEWHASKLDLPLMCVNVSKSQLMSPGFAQTVRRTIKKHGIEPGALELEISERGVLSGAFDIIKQLHELKSLGVRLSIDDFGTGDSAVAYLKDLPVDTLKIDRSYITDITSDSKDAALASAMVAMGQRLDLVVIAEGIETTDQLEVLRDLGCDAYQGFLVSEPIAAELFVARLIKRGIVRAS